MQLQFPSLLSATEAQNESESDLQAFKNIQLCATPF